jgi:hypothetical protein
VGLLIPSVVLEELTYGFMKGERQQFNERKLQQIIQRLGIDIIDVNTNVARKYGLIYLSLDRKGMRIPMNDVLECCLLHGGWRDSADERQALYPSGADRCHDCVITSGRFLCFPLSGKCLVSNIGRLLLPFKSQRTSSWYGLTFAFLLRSHSESVSSLPEEHTYLPCLQHLHQLPPM